MPGLACSEGDGLLAFTGLLVGKRNQTPVALLHCSHRMLKTYASNYLLSPAIITTQALTTHPTRRPQFPPPAEALRWLHYLSVFYYAFEAMITNELNGQMYDFRVGLPIGIPIGLLLVSFVPLRP